MVHLRISRTDKFGADAMLVSAARQFRRDPSHHRADALSNDLYIQETTFSAARAKESAARAALMHDGSSGPRPIVLLYTPEQRRRRDATRWTLVQGILAPLQFLVFLVSLGLVLHYLATGSGYEAAVISIVVKTIVLYVIMITGSIWEREVFGVWLFAPAFFWEDVFSFLVLALHTGYLVALVFDLGTPRQQMLLALAAYGTYLVNATQFVLKLRAARRDERRLFGGSSALTAGGAT